MFSNRGTGRGSGIGTLSMSCCESCVGSIEGISLETVDFVELFVLVGEMSAALTEGSVGELTLAEKSFESNEAVDFVDI